MKSSTWLRLDGIVHFHQDAGRHPVPMRIPRCCERVEVVTDGRGWIWDADAWREVGPGDLIWNGPGDMTIGRSDFENPYCCLAVRLATRRARGSGMPRFSRWPEIEELRAFTAETVRLFHDGEFDRAALLDYVVSQLVFRVRRFAHDARRGRLSPALQRVLRKMERDFSGPCSLAELAAVAGWSVAHLHDVFRRELETTPHQMLIRVRLRMARERLASTNQPIKQIAFECGFADPVAFAHAFRRRLGTTPRAYRRRSQHAA